MKYRIKLLALFKTYCDHVGISEARVSTLIFNHGGRIKQIREGASFTVASLERALNWFSEHWPEDLEWPNDIPRPEVQHDAA